MDESFFNFKISFFRSFISKPVGVTTIKKTKPITIGEIIFPNNKPNLNHNWFNGVKNSEFIKPNIKKIKHKINDQIFISPPPPSNGYVATIKKNVKKTIPKLLLELTLILFFFKLNQ